LFSVRNTPLSDAFTHSPVVGMRLPFTEFATLVLVRLAFLLGVLWQVLSDQLLIRYRRRYFSDELVGTLRLPFGCQNGTCCERAR
jgi:hypothetical protein